jgi:hypothetical protein
MSVVTKHKAKEWNPLAPVALADMTTADYGEDPDARFVMALLEFPEEHGEENTYPITCVKAVPLSRSLIHVFFQAFGQKFGCQF